MNSKSKPGMMKKILLVFLIILVLFTISAGVAEAKTMDSIKNAWGKAKVYVKTAAFWVNAFIMFIIGFLLFTFALKDKVGSDKTQQVVVYIILIVIAILIATKIVDNGTPQYIWDYSQFTKFTRFLLGEKGVECEGRGAGSYSTVIRGDTVCKQGILRINESGAGLPAFIVAFIILYILFQISGSKLGFDKMGSGGGKWFPILLSLLLAGLIANEGTTQDTIIILGGWVVAILLARTLSKTLSDEQDEFGVKKGFAFGLAFALIETIVNMLGTSLIFTWRDYTATDIGIGTIIWNLVIGLIIGFIYSTIAGGGVFSKMMHNIRRKQVEDIDTYCERGEYGKAFMRTIWPGKRWAIPEEEARQDRRIIEMLNNRLDRITAQINALLAQGERLDQAGRARLRQLQIQEAQAWEELQREMARIREGEGGEEGGPGGAPQGGPPGGAAPGGHGGPPAPDV